MPTLEFQMGVNGSGRLAGKTAWITGGGDGIGAAIARVFAREGASVLITGRRKAPLARIAVEIKQEGGNARFIAGSVTDERHVRSAVLAVRRAFGGLNVIVNNAGRGLFDTPLHKTSDRAWRELLDVNLTGVFRVTRAAVPELVRQGGGSVINISSTGALIAIEGGAAYSATKGALNALTRSLAVDYAKQGIRFNAVCPGLVDTSMAASLLNDKKRAARALASYPLGRPGTPGDVAKLAVYLASDESSWVTGSVFPIDGGLTAQ
ncbi:MAG: SDR family NAD(P)-dependent oxidoreductase [Elusimicrobiota bacterium]